MGWFSKITDDFAPLIADQPEESCFDLSYTERLVAAAVCGLFSIFAGLFSIANLMMFACLAFLVGIKRMKASMKEKNRMVAFVIMVIGNVLTFLFAMKFHLLTGVILSFIVEFVAFLYYVLSYVPFCGEKIFSKLSRSILP